MELDQETAAPKKEEDDSGVEYSSLLLLVPAVAVLIFWDDITWLAWTAIVVGALGVVLAVVTLAHHLRKKGRKSEWLPFIFVGVALGRFLSGLWQYLT